MLHSLPAAPHYVHIVLMKILRAASGAAATMAPITDDLCYNVRTPIGMQMLHDRSRPRFSPGS
jgi:hypothetical protein